MREKRPNDSSSFRPVSQEELKYVFSRLRARAFKHYWPLEGYSIDLEQLVVDAIVDVLNGTRNCPASDQSGTKIDFLVCAWQALRSKVSHEVEKSKKRKAGLASINQANSSDSSNPLQEIFSNELIADFKVKNSDDEILGRILDIKLEDFDMPLREMAERLGLTERETEYAWRRCKRHVIRLLKEHGVANPESRLRRRKR